MADGPRRAEMIRPAGVHAVTGYSPAIRVGTTLHVSGQVPRDTTGTIVDPADFEAQARQAFANLEAVLAAAGGALSSVVKLTTYLVDRADFETWRRLRDERFSEPWPASTLVVVAGLSDPGYRLEIEAIAELPERGN